MDQTLRALADPTRRAILELLREGDLAAGEIADRFPMTHATVSHHLGVLRAAELVVATRDGRRIVYALNSTVLQDVMRQVADFLEMGGKP